MTEFEVVGEDYTYHSLYACPDGSMDIQIYMETPVFGGVGSYEAISDDFDGQVNMTSLITTGKLRLRRDSINNIYAYYWNATLSRWEFDGNVNGIFLGNYSGAMAPAIDIRTEGMTAVYVNDFIVTDGCDNTEPFVYV